eukprot:TRINITY_DN2418_c2_g3_i1.p1 TRINITY_DN2418_c2_g3~~TRINITY_DN2418_c2_g3_i1.p1  ORF type:complete len:719 (+),score=123.17 TRINITY_DN2418_c2_g3_i1:74-2230(+)
MSLPSNPNPRGRRKAHGFVNGPLFKTDTKVSWETFWSRVAEMHNLDETAFHQQYGYLFPLIRYLMCCEGEELGEAKPHVSYDVYKGFMNYFPPDSMMNDIRWLNDRGCFLLGAHTTKLQKEMKTNDPSVYYGEGADIPNGRKAYRNGDFLIRPSKRLEGKLVASYLRAGQLFHSVIYYRQQQPCPLLIDGFSNLAPDRTVKSLKQLVRWLIETPGSEFDRPCGVSVAQSDLVSAASHNNTTVSEDDENQLLLAELDEAIKKMGNFTSHDIKIWSESDIDELLKGSLQMDVIKRNKVKRALLNLRNEPGSYVPRTSGMSDMSITNSFGRSGSSWDGRINLAPQHGGYMIKCIEPAGVAYRAEKNLSSIQHSHHGVKHGAIVEVISRDGYFYKTVEGSYLPSEIDGTSCFEVVDTDPPQTPSSESPAETLEMLEITDGTAKYQVQCSSTVLGKGSYGVVRSALDLGSGEQRAIKKLAIVGCDQKELDIVLRESKLMANLSHQNIVRFYGSLLTGSHLHLCMEYMQKTLSQLIKEYIKLPASVVQMYGRQVARGLQYLHSKDVAHRDIKPSNILVDQSGNAKLSDFGCSKNLSSNKGGTQTGTFGYGLVGTPAYMAPEVIMKALADKKEKHDDLKGPDIWATGCTFLEMCTGCKPWKNAEDPLRLMFKIASEPDLLPEFPVDVSPEFLDLLKMSIQRDLKKRLDINQLVDHKFFSMSFERG